MLPTGSTETDTKNAGRKTSPEYWDGVHQVAVRDRLPSRLIVPTRNTLRLLAPYVAPRSRVLEIGFAPGKILLWLAVKRHAQVSGIDYSPQGVDSAKRLFASCRVTADLRCEDIFRASYAADSFDLVYSLGVIEHFADPREVLQRHLALVRPGGVALVAVPNYGNIYARLQKLCDPDNLAIHNLDIMSERALMDLIPDGVVARKRAFLFGRGHLALVSLEKRWPPQIAKAATLIANVAGLLQPVDIPSLCPSIVLELRKH